MIAGFVLVRYRPLRKKMDLVEQAKAAHTIAMAKALAQGSQLSPFKEQLVEFRSSVGDYRTKVPANRNLGDFLQQITNLMNKHDLTEQLIQPGQQFKAEQFNCIPVNMRGTGSFKQIFEFFRSLQTLDRLVRIQRVELLNDSDFGGTVTILADTVVYYQPDGGLG
jgi:Tfp pilus assembly protein PilO